MQQTLFHIPHHIGDLPVFGFGLLLAAWAIGSVVLLARLVSRQGFNADTAGYLPVLGVIAAAILWVLPALCDSVGLPIRGYGVLLLVAIASAVALAVWRARRLGLDPEMIFSLTFWAFIPGIIGARLFYVIEYWHQFSGDGLGETFFRVIKVSEGGLVVYGSLIGGVIGLAAFFAVYRLPPLATLDLIAPSLMLGMGIGRLGCLLNGCCFGGPCDLPWAVTFPVGSPPHQHQLRQDLENGGIYLHGLRLARAIGDRPTVSHVQPDSRAAQAGLAPGQFIQRINDQPTPDLDTAMEVLLAAHVDADQLVVVTDKGRAIRWSIAGQMPASRPIHPTQIYSSLNGLILCLFLLAMDPFRRRDGELWAMLLTVYPITRFLLEIIRTDEPFVFGSGMSISQNISLLLLACAVVLWIWLRLKPTGTAYCLGGASR